LQEEEERRKRTTIAPEIMEEPVEDDDDTNLALILGITFGVLLLILLIVLIIWLWRRRRAARQPDEPAYDWQSLWNTMTWRKSRVAATSETQPEKKAEYASVSITDASKVEQGLQGQAEAEDLSEDESSDDDNDSKEQRELDEKLTSTTNSPPLPTATALSANQVNYSSIVVERSFVTRSSSKKSLETQIP
jgi:hypothetical protein